MYYTKHFWKCKHIQRDWKVTPHFKILIIYLSTIIFTRKGYERKAFSIKFYLKFDMVPDFTISFSSHPGIGSTDFTRNTCGMEYITSCICPLSSSEVLVWYRRLAHLTNPKENSHRMLKSGLLAIHSYIK